jgi:TonB family protein
MSNTLAQTAIRLDLPRSITLVEPVVERRGRRWGRQQAEANAEDTTLEFIERALNASQAGAGKTAFRDDSEPQSESASKMHSDPVSKDAAELPDSLPAGPQSLPESPGPVEGSALFRNQRAMKGAGQSGSPPAAGAPGPAPRKPLLSPPGIAVRGAPTGEPATTQTPQGREGAARLVAAPNVRLAGFPEAATGRACIGDDPEGERIGSRRGDTAFPTAGVSSDSPADRGLRASPPGATPPDKDGREPLTTPVRILFKPRPRYPAQSIERRLQGDVLVDVEFRYSGALEILGVRQGLSPGLNESAIEAIRKIRFLPARQDGRPVDTQATVRIRFNIAP